MGNDNFAKIDPWLPEV